MNEKEKKNKYVNIQCPCGRTVYTVRKQKNVVITCKCGKKLMLMQSKNGYEFQEV